MSGAAWRRLMLGASLALLAGACSGSSGHAAPTTSRPVATSTSTTTVAIQTSGPRTVLSPIGVNVRAQPERAATVLGTAAQGVVLSVLGHTSNGGGWFEVKGATVTGWISGDPDLSAPGEFRRYSSGQFDALYPAVWTPAASPPSSVVFRPDSGAGDIVVTAAPSVTALPDGRAGYGRTGFSPIVVCGVTSELITFQGAPSPGTTAAGRAAPATPYLAQIRLTLDPKNALGMYADLTNLESQLSLFRAFVASVTFPFPQCVGH